jgi:hypothetical protein
VNEIKPPRPGWFGRRRGSNVELAQIKGSVRANLGREEG